MKIHNICLILALCLLYQPGMASADAGQTVDITVAPQDTLISMCKKYLDYPEQWPLISKLNHLANSDTIVPGQILKVPVEMLKGTPVDGTITFLKGTAKTTADGQAAGQKLHLQDVIRGGDSVQTAQDSAVEISFIDGTVLLMKANTTLKVITSKITPTLVLRRVYLEAGKFISRIKSATGRENRYEVQTASSMAAARGTEYRVSVNAEQTTRAEVLAGIVDVSAMGSKVATNMDEGTLVMQGSPPSQPVKLLPPPTAIGLEPLYPGTPFNVQFAKIAGATAYRIVLAKDCDSKDVALEKVIRPDEKLAVGDLEDGIYFLTSLSIDANELEGRPSAPAEILVKTPPPVAAPQPVAIAPPAVPLLEKPTVTGKEIHLKWGKVGEGIAYQVQVAREEDFKEIITDRKVAQLEITLGNLLSTGKYYLRIRSLKADISSDFSGPKSCIITPPAVPYVDEPTFTSKEIKIKWGSVGEGISYQVQVAKSEDFKEIITDSTVSLPEITLEKLPTDSKFYLRIRSIDKDNYASEFSTPQGFTSKNSFPKEILGVLGVGLLLSL